MAVTIDCRNGVFVGDELVESGHDKVLDRILWNNELVMSIGFSTVFTFWGVMSYSTACCSPSRMRLEVIVLRSLAVRMESMITTYEASTSGGTIQPCLSKCGRPAL